MSAGCPSSTWWCFKLPVGAEGTVLWGVGAGGRRVQFHVIYLCKTYVTPASRESRPLPHAKGNFASRIFKLGGNSSPQVAQERRCDAPAELGAGGVSALPWGPSRATSLPWGPGAAGTGPPAWALRLPCLLWAPPGCSLARPGPRGAGGSSLREPLLSSSPLGRLRRTTWCPGRRRADFLLPAGPPSLARGIPRV